MGDNIPFEEETLSLAEGGLAILVHSPDPIVRDQACDAGANVGEGGEENEGVGDRPQPSEESKGDEDQGDSK